MKKTNMLLFTCFNLIFCLITILVCTSYNNNNSYAINEKTTKITNIHEDSLFDVADYPNESFTPIDLNSKIYGDDITILDTNYRISDKLLNTIKEDITNYGQPVSFYIVSLKDGMTIGYNVDKYFETASSIKAPYALYIYKEIANGNIDENKKLIYTKNYYKTGTGIIKNSEEGTEYTIEELVKYSIQESDNVAHNMLHKTFGVNGYNNMLKNIGTKYLFKEIIPNKLSASKTGFASLDVIETGIVFDDEYPYIAIAVANKGGKIGAYTEVLKLINYINNVMNEYKEFKHN